MGLVLRLIETRADGGTCSIDVLELSRLSDLGDIASLGLTLPEAKQILARVQQALVAAFFGMGLLSTALAYVLYSRILAVAGATNLLLVTFLIPVSAILLGALVLGGALLPRHFGGMSLIGAGLACIDGRLPRLLFGRRKRRTMGGFDPQI